MRTHSERQDQQIEALFERVAYLEHANAQQANDLRATRAERDEAHERIDAMLADYVRIQRSGRLPKTTPASFKIDHTVPFHTQGKAT